MTEEVAASFEDLHKLFRHYRSHHGFGWLFRGQADAIWKLLPRAGRPEYFQGTDLGRFNAWRKEACAHQELPANDWECLAIAQHYGLATRLLDWSTNPLVATFFATSELPEAAGALFCYSADVFVQHEIASLDACDRVVAYLPRAIDERINRQQGVFTFHPEPNVELAAGQLEKPLVGPNLVKIRIPADAKESILTVLSDYGVDAHRLFPDLDGLSRKINHETVQSLRRKVLRRERSRLGSTAPDRESSAG